MENAFFGREDLLADLLALWHKRVPSFVTCRGRRRIGKSVVKYPRSTWAVPLILRFWSTVAVGGMGSVAVKCIDITQNTDCEGISRRVD